jgi:hypothetical protein
MRSWFIYPKIIKIQNVKRLTDIVDQSKFVTNIDIVTQFKR